MALVQLGSAHGEEPNMVLLYWLTQPPSMEMADCPHAKWGTSPDLDENESSRGHQLSRPTEAADLTNI